MKNLNELLKNINDNVEKYFIENFNFEDLGENFVLDIESCGLNNNTECLVYSIAIMDIDDNLNNCYVFRSVHQFMEAIINAKKEINFYIHNLSFDIKPFLISFIEDYQGQHVDKVIYEKQWKNFIDKKTYDINVLNSSAKQDLKTFQYDTMIKDGNFYKATIKGKEFNINFLDTLKLFPFSLQKACSGLLNLNLPKDGLDYEKERKLYEKFTHDEKVYIYNDVFGLKYLVKTYCIEGITISDRFIKFDKITISGQTFDNFKHFLLEDYENKTGCFAYDHVYDYVDNRLMKTKFYSETSEKNRRELVFRALFPKQNYFVDQYERRSYYGGLSYVHKENVEKYYKMDNKIGNVYDVNSLYPFTMETFDLPFGVGVYNKKPYHKMSKNFKKNYPLYIQEITIYDLEVKPNKINFLQVKHNKFFKGNECIKNNVVNGKKIPLKLHLTNVTLDLLKECYDLKVVSYGSHIAFMSTQDIFKSYLDFWKKVKMENKGAVRNIAKLFQNSLYGKFGMRGESDIVYASSEDGKFTLDYNTKDVVGDTIYLPIATFITSYAKRYLCNAINANYENFLYCDTDSIHLIGNEVKGLTLHNKIYGCWANELTFDNAKYLGQKRYCERNIETKEWEIKCCGLSDNIMKQVDDLEVFDNCKHSNKELSKMAYYTKNDSIYYYYDKECTKKIKGLFKSKKAKQVKGGTLILETPYMLSDSYYSIMK